jgi:intracellular multiplication protein IcmD
MVNFRQSGRAIKNAILFTGLPFLCYVESTYAASSTTISGIAGNLHKLFTTFAKLITGGSVLAGLGFALAAILKFKAHKDNPTQIPVGTPIALLMIAVALLFLPYIFGAAGASVFGGSAESGLSGVSVLK